MLTEAEAKEKWCAMVGSNASGSASTNCLGSGCMLWQWLPQVHYRKTELWSKSRNAKVNSAYGDDAEWRPIHGDKSDDPPPAVGFCGLARSNAR